MAGAAEHRPRTAAACRQLLLPAADLPKPGPAHQGAEVCGDKTSLSCVTLCLCHALNPLEVGPPCPAAAGMDAVQLAFELDFPPCVLMRRLLEALQLGLAKERITRVLRAPEQLPELVSPEALEALACAAAAAAAAAQASSGEATSSSAAAAGGPLAGGQQQQPGEGRLDEAGALQERGRRLLKRLQRDVEACVQCDRIYSPASGGCSSRCCSLPDCCARPELPWGRGTGAG